MKPQVIDIYARVSRKGDKEQRSTTGQVASCRAVLRDRGLSAGLVLVDDGRSAWNPSVVRDGWEALMARIESGESGGVIVFDLERFARKPKDGERLIEAAERGIVVLDSDAEFDLTTASGKKSFRDAMAAAAYYSDRLSDRTRRGKRTKAMAGSVDARRSFGFELDGVTLRESEAEVVRDCARRLLAGETQDSLLRELRAAGVPTVRGAAWGYTTFRQVMTRPRNAGYICHRGVVVPGVKLPAAILDDETHERLVGLYASRRPGKLPSGRYLLTGLAFCGRCDAKLSGRPVSGTDRRHYWCKPCAGVSVDVARLDSWAGDFAVSVLADPAHAEAVSRAEEELASKRSSLEAKRDSMEGVLRELGARLGRGEMDLDAHDAAVGPLRARLVAVRDQVRVLEDSRAAAVPVGPGIALTPRQELYGDWLAAWTDCGTAEKRALVVRALGGRRLVVGPSGKRADRGWDAERVTVV
jgi:site-specific DNA recombinase